MCSVVGYFGPDIHPSDGQALLQRMSSTVAHRGPDADGHVVREQLGLGHRRLAIVGIQDGQQPMASASGELLVSFNGEIFNYPELRSELELAGHRFRTNCDTEILLHLYERFGDDFVNRLNGDFAFALWDERRRRLVLARDRMGVRPLFYARRGKTLFFASEIKALMEVPGITAELDPKALDEIFTFWTPVAPLTAFKSIFELPPAHLMVVSEGGDVSRPYWQLQFPDADDAAFFDRHDEAKEEVKSLLDDAIRIRLRADVTVGCYLSGGLDSSIIAGLASRQVADPLRTFSVTFDDALYDERAFQSAVVSHLETDHRSLAITAHDIGASFLKAVWHAERPILRTAPAPMLALAGLVRSEGIKVVLTGEGADEVFAGYDIFREAKVRRFTARQPGSRIRPLLFRKLYRYLVDLNRQPAEYLARFFQVEADTLDDPLFSHRPRFRNTASSKMFFSDALRSDLGDYDCCHALIERLPADFRRWHPLHQAQYLETTILLPGYILSSQGDRMSMAHGVEGRYPFLDHRVVELAARIPVQMKLKGLEEKHILKQAAHGMLPASVESRSKQPYRAPESHSFRTAPYVAELMSNEAIAETGLFNPSAVDRLTRKCLTQDARGFRDNAAFVGILSTQILAKQFAMSTH